MSALCPSAFSAKEQAMTHEQPVVYRGANSQLFGVLHRPSSGRDLRHGVLFVPGEPDFLFGDHSMYVYSARQVGYRDVRFVFVK